MTITRNASFRIVDECLDQALIKAIPPMLEAWFDRENASSTDSPDDFLLEHMRRILAAFQQANHPFTDFVDAFANKHSSHLLRSRKKTRSHNELGRRIGRDRIHQRSQYVLENGGIILSSVQRVLTKTTKTYRRSLATKLDVCRSLNFCLRCCESVAHCSAAGKCANLTDNHRLRNWAGRRRWRHRMSGVTQHKPVFHPSF